MNLTRELMNTLTGVFRMPSADMMAVRELEEAKRSLLQMQTAQDYAKRMCEYHQDRCKRLTAYIAKEHV
jgi:hypothetical protein